MKQYKHAGRWDLLPIGKSLTISQVAEIVGIKRDTLINNYTGTKPYRKFPVPVDVIREKSRTIFLIRRS